MPRPVQLNWECMDAIHFLQGTGLSLGNLHTPLVTARGPFLMELFPTGTERESFSVCVCVCVFVQCYECMHQGATQKNKALTLLLSPVPCNLCLWMVQNVEATSQSQHSPLTLNSPTDILCRAP